MTEKVTEAGQPDAVIDIARHLVRVQFDDLPSEIVDATKKSILDTVGVTLGASGSPEIVQLVDLIAGVGGEEQSTILGFGKRVPAWNAGYLNGSMAHCLDYDDIFLPAQVHLSAAVIPAALALAESKGAVTGQQFVAAVALGIDLFARLALAVGGSGSSRWLLMPVLGVFGATAACSKILGLSQRETVNALGIAYTRASGSSDIVWASGSNIRGFYNNVPGEEGVRSVLMARRGIVGIQPSLEGRAGLLPLYFEGRYDRNALLNNLGSVYPAAQNGFKPWPTQAQTHAYIEIVLDLVRAHNLAPQNIRAIVLTSGEITRRVCEPVEERRAPKSLIDGRISLHFLVAMAAIKRKVDLSTLVPESLRDTALLDLARQVHFVVDDALSTEGTFAPALVEIQMHDGRSFKKRQDVAYGHPSRPMSWDDLVSKFQDCAGQAIQPPAPADLEKAVNILRNLEQCDDVTQVPRLLSRCS